MTTKIKNCSVCNKDILNSNWSRHLKTKTHINKSNGNTNKVITEHNCTECEYKSKTRQGLHRHKKIHSDEPHYVTYKGFCKICNEPIKNWKNDMLSMLKHAGTKKHKALIMEMAKTTNPEFRHPLLQGLINTKVTNKYIINRNTKVLVNR